MFRKSLALVLAIAIAWVTVTGGPLPVRAAELPSAIVAAAPSAAKSLADGRYPVQQAAFDDGTGEYALMLLDTPAGSSPLFRTTELQMARLDDEAIAQGQKPYLALKDGQPVLYLDKDFKIEYVHQETAVQTNPRTGEQQTVVVQRESSSWSPFMAALEGQMLANMLFRPHYVLPPAYAPGGMVGYGGYGRSYGDAVGNYRDRYQAAPAVERNRQQFRATGTAARSAATMGRPATANNVKSTGSGFGSSNFRSSPNRRIAAPQPRSSFGSSYGRSPVRMRSSFGSGFRGGRRR
ncbi:MAG: hypothetical protein EA001_13925 [Oscillatoriales cyanobacterium]|nr:MAG: hypothetical protein EA001_13925 [Oscillatoriales cyanobacterium]